jgi:hypothetical protein
MSLDELADSMNFREDSLLHLQAKAELLRRQMLAQYEAIEAQKSAAQAEAKAAEASVLSAEAAHRNAQYMLWSVIVAAISASASALSAYFAYLSAVHPK